VIGYAKVMGAATILNAVATWKGSAFGIDLETRAEVELERSAGIKGNIPGIDDRLVVRCVELVLERFDIKRGGVVRTSSEIPVARGLKSSSTAANATVLATLDAIGEKMDLVEAAKIGVAAAKEVGVTITGALDDALASMLGGVVVIDNREMKLIKREEMESDVLLLVPEKKLFSKDTDVRKSKLIAPLAELAFDLAMKGDYGRAMTLNGFIYCSALGLPAEPLLVALEMGAWGTSLSGTGPSYAALIEGDRIEALETAWNRFGGRVIRTKVNNRPATIGSRGSIGSSGAPIGD
jgi:shikimate kinase